MQDDVIKASNSKTIKKTANELLAFRSEQLFVFKFLKLFCKSRINIE
jgi:hypothetical protein